MAVCVLTTHSYVSGRVAACASKVSEYQRSFQFYENSAKKTLLGTLDEHAVRLCCCIIVCLNCSLAAILNMITLGSYRSGLLAIRVGRSSSSRKSLASS